MSGIAALANIEKRSSFRRQPGIGRFPARTSKKPVKSNSTNVATSPPVTAKMPVTIAAPPYRRRLYARITELSSPAMGEIHSAGFRSPKVAACGGWNHEPVDGSASAKVL
jgi:hypothetical protein